MRPSGRFGWRWIGPQLITFIIVASSGLAPSSSASAAGGTDRDAGRLSADAGPAPAQPCLASFLDEEGRLDHERMRAAGYEGTLDLSGHRWRMGGSAGRPVFARSGSSGGSAAPALVDDSGWTGEFGPAGGVTVDTPGYACEVTALAVYNGELVVGGLFDRAGGVPARNIARWDGCSWRALGAGLDSNPNALAVYGGLLFAGGNFTGHIASWNGTSWSTPGGAATGTVDALIAYSDPVAGSVLVAGGGFLQIGGTLARYIARWNGGTWSTMGTGMDQPVGSLGVYGTNLIAGGDFSQAGGFPASHIAQWNGSGWSAMGSGTDNSPHAFFTYQGNLIVGGTFTHAGGMSAGYIASWNGTSWSAFGGGMSQSVYSLAIYGGDLVAAGYFTLAGSVPADRIARWDGTSWKPMGTGVDDGILALAEFGGNLVAGGQLTTAGGQGAERLARWDGSAWLPWGLGIQAPLTCLGTFAGNLYAGGYFTFAGTTAANYIARWDGAQWTALGSGLSNGGNPAPPYALYDQTTLLRIGGNFSGAGGAIAMNHATWNGTSLTSATPGTNDGIRAFGRLSFTLYLGGMFTQAGGSPANYIARSLLGMAGMNSPVFALLPCGSGLIAGGDFTTAGAVTANHVANWGGTTWSALGTGMNGTVFCLATHTGDLIAGGNFTTAGGIGANNIARWDGASWSPLGSGLDGMVFALAEYDGFLVAAGRFSTAGGVPATNIAFWDGAAWSNLGSGTDGDVTSLCVLGTDLWVGGWFSEAGNREACHIARWSSPLSGVAPPEADTPVAWLDEICPNPVRDRAAVTYALPHGGLVSLTLHDATGRLVRRLVARAEGAGPHSVSWSTRDEEGVRLANGTYFCALRLDGRLSARRLTVIR